MCDTFFGGYVFLFLHILTVYLRNYFFVQKCLFREVEINNVIVGVFQCFWVCL